MPFDEYSNEYDNWFIKNQNIYNSELNAIKSFISPGLYGIEIGVGTGRFAKPLCIEMGVEPSNYMAKIARSRGIKVFNGVAENLPIGDAEFDFSLMVTAICFFDDVKKAFKEAYRILKHDGFLVVAFIDKESKLGRFYKGHKQNNKFYKNATFYSVKEITDLLISEGFKNLEYNQTVYNSENVMQKIESGYGRGSFIVIKAYK